MLNLPNGKVTLSQVLLPVGILAFVVFVFLGFQFTQILRDRDNMHQAMAQQEKALADALHVQEQLNALAVGTQKLADKGDKDAEAIIQRMNKLGIKVNVNAPGMPAAPAQGRAPMGAAPKAPPPPPPETPPN
jgi:hypothetical protein